MIIRLFAVLALVPLFTFIGIVHGQQTSSGIVTLHMESLEWQQATVGWEIAALYGNMSSDDTSIVRLKMPPNWDAPPHTHERTELEVVSIHSGTLYIAFGENLSRDAAQAFGPGAFIAYPAGTTTKFFTGGKVVVADVYHLRNPQQTSEKL